MVLPSGMDGTELGHGYGGTRTEERGLSSAVMKGFDEVSGAASIFGSIASIYGSVASIYGSIASICGCISSIYVTKGFDEPRRACLYGSVASIYGSVTSIYAILAPIYASTASTSVTCAGKGDGAGVHAWKGDGAGVHGRNGKGTALVCMDGDLQHPPEKAPLLLK
eukprot:1385557-Rhodomonas_salina.1